MNDLPVPSSARPKGALLLLAGVVLGLGIAGSGAYALREPLRHWLLAENDVKISELLQRQEQLAAKLRQLAERPAETAPANLADRVEAVERDIDQLRRAIPPEGALIRLTERAEAAERSAHSQAAGQAVLLTLGQLREAVERGDPYGSELASARILLPLDDAPLLAPMAEGAESGIPRRDQLAERFSELAEALVRQERQVTGRGVWAAISTEFRKLVRIRRVDGKGNDAEAVVSRAETAMKQGDWDGAVAEIQALPGNFQATAAPWLADAERRQAADRALSHLTTQAVARLAAH